MRALVLLLLLSSMAKAQTYDEFFRQKKTQQKYLIQQLAALKMYTGYLKKGYDITNEGIQTIKGFTKGEFSLHETYLKSLKAINPATIDKSKILEIAALQISINRSFNAIVRNANLSESFKIYITDVKRSVLTDCGNNLDELFLIITNEKLELKDDERIKHIEFIYRQMKDNYEFVQSFSNEVKLLINQREQEASDNRSLEKMYQSIN